MSLQCVALYVFKGPNQVYLYGEDVFVTHLIVIIKSEISNSPTRVIFVHVCASECGGTFIFC